MIDGLESMRRLAAILRRDFAAQLSDESDILSSSDEMTGLSLLIELSLVLRLSCEFVFRPKFYKNVKSRIVNHNDDTDTYLESLLNNCNVLA